MNKPVEAAAATMTGAEAVVEILKAARQFEGAIDVVAGQRVVPLRREILPRHPAAPAVPFRPVNAMREPRAVRGGDRHIRASSIRHVALEVRVDADGYARTHRRERGISEDRGEW